MTTDVQVQFFSHLNGLNLGNNWGDLIRLLDATLVNGVSLPSITAASIDEQGDVHLSFYTDHKALLFQVVELAGFAPELLNQKYRIKGVPSATSLILKPKIALSETVISSSGTAKLAPLGYEIIFRDVNDVKRVYRAKNPTTQHPFIRVDETISGLNGNYSDTYAKSAMVGLLESMAHIDDYKDPNKLQLPLDVANFSKNWEINGVDGDVVRGWYKWYYATIGDTRSITETGRPTSGPRNFTIAGDFNCFYLTPSLPINSPKSKIIYGCGLFNSALPCDVIPNWFLMATQKQNTASNSVSINNSRGYSPLLNNAACSEFLALDYNPVERIINSSTPAAILQSYGSGGSSVYANNVAALEIPIRDNYLRGTLQCVSWAGVYLGNIEKTTSIPSDKSMYVVDSISFSQTGAGGFYFYLGELE